MIRLLPFPHPVPKFSQPSGSSQGDALAGKVGKVGGGDVRERPAVFSFDITPAGELQESQARAIVSPNLRHAESRIDRQLVEDRAP